jgi:hypothetical protein
MIPFGEAVCVRRVSRLVLTCMCLRRAWHEALGCPVWIDSHVYMSGFRTDLSSYHRVAATHTESSDTKRVIVIIIVVIVIVIVIVLPLSRALCLSVSLSPLPSLPLSRTRALLLHEWKA